MNKNKINKKRLTFTLLSAALIIAVAVSATLAYFTDLDEVTNTFVMGDVEIQLEEPSWDEDSGLDLKPGGVCEKDPTITALEGQSYMRIRMQIVDGEGKLITDESRIGLILDTLYYDVAYGKDNSTLETNRQYNVSKLDQFIAENKIQKEYNQTDFIFAGTQTGQPGVRYYNYIANGGIFDADKAPQNKTVFFSHVVIPRDWHNEEIFDLNGDTYKTHENGVVEITSPGTGYKILLRAESIQSSDMKDANEAFEALNKATGVTIG